MSHCLVVAHQTATSPALTDCIANVMGQDPEAEFTLLVPATPIEHLGGLMQGDARSVARRVAQAGKAALEAAGARVTRTVVGDASPLLAIDDELRERPDTYHSIIIATLPPGTSRWLRLDLPQRAEDKFGIRVIHITAQPAEMAVAMAHKDTTSDASTSMAALVVPLFIRALAGDQPLPTRDARNALVALGGLAVPYLLAATDHRDRNIRLGAFKVLAKTATPDCAPVLIDALQDPDGGIRWLAAEATVHAGPEVLSTLLLAVMRHSNSAWMQDGARHILGRLREHPGYPAALLTPVAMSLNGSSPSVSLMTAASEAMRQLRASPAA
jgi:hypothetical protein